MEQNDIVNFKSIDRNIFSIRCNCNSILTDFFNSIENSFINYLFVIVSGEVTVNSKKICKNEIFRLGKSDSIEIEENFVQLVGFQLNLSSKESIMNKTIILPPFELSYYEKYDAKISRINYLIDHIDQLLPWSFYFAELMFKNEIVLHIHKDVRNILFFTGNEDETLGYLIIQNEAKNNAFPIRNGDTAIVEPNVLHNICSIKGKTIGFYIINDNISDYEHPENSDYHNICTIKYSDLIVQERVSNYPIQYSF